MPPLFCFVDHIQIWNKNDVSYSNRTLPKCLLLEEHVMNWKIYLYKARYTRCKFIMASVSKIISRIDESWANTHDSFPRVSILNTNFLTWTWSIHQTLCTRYMRNLQISKKELFYYLWYYLNPLFVIEC
jgi:hypothetical protein